MTTTQCTPTLHFLETCHNPNVRQEVLKRLNIVWIYKFIPIRVHCVRGRLYCNFLELHASVTQANDDEVESEGEVGESQHHAIGNVAWRMQQEISLMREAVQDLTVCFCLTCLVL